MGIAAAGNSGTVLAMLFAPRLGELVGWHGVFGFVLIPLILTLVLFVALVQPNRGVSRQEQKQSWWDTTVASVTQPSMCWVSFLYAVTFGGFVGFCSFLPIFLHDHYGVNVVTAGTITAVSGLIGSLIRPVGGYLADRFGGLLVLRAVFVGIALCVGAVGWLPPLKYAAACTVAGIGAMGCGNGAVFQVVSVKFPKQMGMASGLVGAAGGFGGFLLPFFLGFLKDLTGTFQTGLWLFSAAAILAAITVRFALQQGTPVLCSDRSPDGFSG